MSKLVKGDKIKLVRPMGIMNNIGEVCEVIDVDENCGSIAFLFGEGMHYGCMSFDEYAKYFVKVEDTDNDNTTSDNTEKEKEIDMDDFKLYLEHEDKDIERAFDNAKVCIYTAFDKCTIVAVKLANGFVVTESSACVNPEDYDEKLGIELCMKKIVEHVYEMVAYEKHTKKQTEEKLRKISEKAKEHINKDVKNKKINKLDELYKCDGDCEHCFDNPSKDENYDNNFLKFLDDIIFGSH